MKETWVDDDVVNDGARGVFGNEFEGATVAQSTLEVGLFREAFPGQTFCAGCTSIENHQVGGTQQAMEFCATGITFAIVVQGSSRWYLWIGRIVRVAEFGVETRAGGWCASIKVAQDYDVVLPPMFGYLRCEVSEMRRMVTSGQSCVMRDVNAVYDGGEALECW